MMKPTSVRLLDNRTKGTGSSNRIIGRREITSNSNITQQPRYVNRYPPQKQQEQQHVEKTLNNVEERRYTTEETGRKAIVREVNEEDEILKEESATHVVDSDHYGVPNNTIDNTTVLGRDVNHKTPRIRPNEQLVKNALKSFGIAPSGIHYIVLLDKCRKAPNQEKCTEIVREYLAARKEKSQQTMQLLPHLQKRTTLYRKTAQDQANSSKSTTTEITKEDEAFLKSVSSSYQDKGLDMEELRILAFQYRRKMLMDRNYVDATQVVDFTSSTVHNNGTTITQGTRRFPLFTNDATIYKQSSIDSTGKHKILAKLGFHIDDKKPKILFCGTVGTSGYAAASKNWVYSLLMQGYDIDFEPVQFHATNFANDSAREDALIACFMHSNHYHNAKSAETSKLTIGYDIILIHSIPDLWPHLVKSLRLVNPGCVIVGITVWESSKIHPKWKEYMQQVDYLFAPCCWNQSVFERDSGIQCICVPTPVELYQQQHIPVIQRTTTKGITTDSISNLSSSSPLLGTILPSDTVFYTINEWNARKGIEDLIDAFIREFYKQEDVVLYLKCVHVPKESGQSYIRSRIQHWQTTQISDKHTNDNGYNNKNSQRGIIDRIILDVRVLKDSEIESIHSRGDVYISLCKSEGTGMGAVEAITYGNPVIMTAYGGQLDYLKSGVYYVSFHEEVPSMCTPLRPGHSKEDGCFPERGFCKKYPWYLPNQTWGRANLEDAQRIMRFVYEELEDCRQQVQLGKKYLERFCSFSVVGKQMHDLFTQMLSPV